MSTQEQKLVVLDQYQKILQSEIKHLQQAVEGSLSAEAFNTVRETISMIFSKMAEGSHLSSSSKSLKQYSNGNVNMKHLNMTTSKSLETSQQLYNELIARNHELQKADRRFQRRLEKIEILLYQKDYEEALAKIDGYKKNNITFETEDDAEDGLKSVNDTINQAFCQSGMQEAVQHTHTYSTIKNIIDDDAVSLSVKERLIFQLLCDDCQEDQEKDSLHHVTLEQVLQAKRIYEKKQTSPMLMEPLELITQRLKNCQALFQNENKHPFDNRVILQNLISLQNQSPIQSRESLKQYNRKLQQPESSQHKYQQTGKKKALGSPTDLSCLNTLSEVYNSETGKKLLTKRERSMTSRKREVGDDKKSKTLTKQTEKKKPMKRLITNTISNPKSFR